MIIGTRREGGDDIYFDDDVYFDFGLAVTMCW
jgi:hypothetical protein